MKFKVNYSGFYYIEADSEDDVIESCRDDAEVIYDECGNDSVENVDDFIVRF